MFSHVIDICNKKSKPLISEKHNPKSKFVARVQREKSIIYISILKYLVNSHAKVDKWAEEKTSKSLGMPDKKNPRHFVT